MSKIKTEEKNAIKKLADWVEFFLDQTNDVKSNDKDYLKAVAKKREYIKIIRNFLTKASL